MTMTTEQIDAAIEAKLAEKQKWTWKKIAITTAQVVAVAAAGVVIYKQGSSIKQLKAAQAPAMPQ